MPADTVDDTNTLEMYKNIWLISLQEHLKPINHWEKKSDICQRITQLTAINYITERKKVANREFKVSWL